MSIISQQEQVIIRNSAQIYWLNWKDLLLPLILPLVEILDTMDWEAWIEKFLTFMQISMPDLSTEVQLMNSSREILPKKMLLDHLLSIT